MPVIMLNLPPEFASGETKTDTQSFQQDCHYLCIQMLDATPENIQIQMLASCLPPLGRAVYADVKYRCQPHRNNVLMSLFMQELESTIVRHCRTWSPRIRCFPFPPEQLYTRN